MSDHVLVTGAAGFVGSHLCDALLALGYRVTGVDCFTDYYSRERKQDNISPALASTAFSLIEGDLREIGLAQVLRGVDLIYHLAGQPGVRGSWGHQFGQYSRNNVEATQRLLEAAMAVGGIPLVYASSSSVYGNLTTMPLREDMTPAPVSPYGVTKLAAEHLCRLYTSVHDLPTISLRLFTVYGPRQRPDMAFQRFLTALLREEEIIVFGDGSQTRDFTYVGDVVAALLRAGDCCIDGHHSGQVFNIAGGARVSLTQVLAQISEATGRQLRVRYQDAQPGDVRDTWADPSQAERSLGFRARIGLSDGLEKQWRQVMA